MKHKLYNLESLSLIDQQCFHQLETFSPAEYQILRDLILATADFQYQSLIKFTPGAMVQGAGALAAKAPIIVDVPMIQGAILPELEGTFDNPVYSAYTIIARHQKDPSELAWGMEMLTKRFPEAIVIIGQDQESLMLLTELIELQTIQPALIIATPPGLVGAEIAKSRLLDTGAPQIQVEGVLGGPQVAVAIFNSLVNLGWQAYEQNSANLIKLPEILDPTKTDGD